MILLSSLYFEQCVLAVSEFLDTRFPVQLIARITIECEIIILLLLINLNNVRIRTEALLLYMKVNGQHFEDLLNKQKP